MFSLDALFCQVDDFCKRFEVEWHKKLLKKDFLLQALLIILIIVPNLIKMVIIHLLGIVPK